jgi:probable HAF family extracellular repeat protein
MKRYMLAAASALLVLVHGNAAVRADAPLYTVQNLGTFGGLVPTISGINASGQVVGNVSTNGSQAVRYTDGLGWQALPGLDTSFSQAFGIDDNGDVVGYHVTSSNQFRAFRYRDGHGVEDIEPLTGGTLTVGAAINNAGTVVGFSDSSSGFAIFSAVLGQPAMALPALGGTMPNACGVNTAGQVAGYSDTPSGAQHGMRIDPGVPSPVEIVSPDGASFTVTACAIDEAGRVGGQLDRASGQTHAFRYTDAAGVQDLDTFGSPLSNIESLAAGVSVGWYTQPDGTVHAFANRDPDGSFDLNTRIDAAGWVLTDAKGVNVSGMIAGEGLFNGASAVFRLTPQQSDTTPPVINSVTATPSVIFPPKGQTVPVSIAVDATDNSGQTPTCTVSSITGPGAPPVDFNVTGPLAGTVLAVGGRTYTFNVKCVDAANNSAFSSASVTVTPDTTPPVIASVSATPSNLWPPDGRLVPVTVSVSATDDVDATPSCALSGVTGVGSPDEAAITGPLAATLRAVGGRTYGLVVRCSDSAGNASTKSATVVVPPDVTPPVITSLSAAPGMIWPANNKMVTVSIAVSATDDVDASPACGLTSVTGGPASDVVITGQFTADVRASKDPNGAMRTYMFNVSCRDQAGNASNAAVSVSVSKDHPSTVYFYGRRNRNGHGG